MGRIGSLALLSLCCCCAILPPPAMGFRIPATRAQQRHHDAIRKKSLFPCSSTTRDDASAGVTSTSKEKIPYDWKEQWYALTFASYVPHPSQSAETTPAAVFGTPLVLWRQEDGKIYCADDVCPHRAAALSEGRVRDDKLECLYHGWQFAGPTGNCERIPQLEKGAEIPRRACLKMRTCQESEGLVWVWMGDGKPAFDPPATGVLEVNGKAEGWNVYDFMIDLPYDHSYLIENLLDPAHIPISHDKTPGGGKRENAEGYEMIVDEDSFSPRGFKGRFRMLSRQATNGTFTDFEFEAPGIVRNKFQGNINGREISFCAALHCMPLGLGRSRLFFRIYNKGLPAIANFMLRLKPLWLRHLNSCKVLEQDVGLITTQEDHFARSGRALADDFLLLQSSDAYVGGYRRWLDRVGHGMPWFQGLASSSKPNAHVPSGTLPPGLIPAKHRSSNQNVVETRYHRHVLHCPTTRKALRNVQRCKRAFGGLAGMALATMCALVPLMVGSTPSARLWRLFRLATLALPLGMVGTFGLGSLEREFYESFKRKDQLRHESGLLP